MLEAAGCFKESQNLLNKWIGGRCQITLAFEEKLYWKAQCTVLYRQSMPPAHREACHSRRNWRHALSWARDCEQLPLCPQASSIFYRNKPIFHKSSSCKSEPTTVSLWRDFINPQCNIQWCTRYHPVSHENHHYRPHHHGPHLLGHNDYLSQNDLFNQIILNIIISTFSLSSSSSPSSSMGQS